MEKIDLDQRIYNFALEIVKLVRCLPKEVAAYEIGRQLLRAGTSIAANYEEARGAFSREDFTYKINTAFKEARESNLWLRLLKDSGLYTDKEAKYLLKESEEIRNILGKSVKTSREGNMEVRRKA